jgi:uncharacterized protein (TIGR00297 family)
MSWLSPRGTFAALLVGGAVAAGSGWTGLVLLFAFFLSSTWLTPGGGRRSAAQVAANGGVAAAAALLSRLNPIGTAAFAGALAAAAADTWSTEIGDRSRSAPRLVTTRVAVPRGTSGAVTWLGTAGGAAGAAFIAAVAALLGLVDPRAAAFVAAGGLAGAFADSLLGATLQARYRCPACGAVGETRRHGCGATGVLVSGLAWMTNDTVNLAATLVGAAVAVLPALLGVPVVPS